MLCTDTVSSALTVMPWTSASGVTLKVFDASVIPVIAPTRFSLAFVTVKERPLLFLQCFLNRYSLPVRGVEAAVLKSDPLNFADRAAPSTPFGNVTATEMRSTPATPDASLSDADGFTA